MYLTTESNQVMALTISAALESDDLERELQEVVQWKRGQS